MATKENVSMLVRGASQLARREVCELGQVCSAPSASVSLMCLTHHAAVTLASFSSNAPTDFLLGSPPWSMRPPLPEAIYPSPDWAPLSQVTSLMNPSSILEGEVVLSAITSRPQRLFYTQASFSFTMITTYNLASLLCCNSVRTLAVYEIGWIECFG